MSKTRRANPGCSYCGGAGVVGKGTPLEPYEMCHVCFRPEENTTRGARARAPASRSPAESVQNTPRREKGSIGDPAATAAAEAIKTQVAPYLQVASGLATSALEIAGVVGDVATELRAIFSPPKKRRRRR